MPPVRSYTNWNSRSTDYEKQIGHIVSISLFAKVLTQRHGIFGN